MKYGFHSEARLEYREAAVYYEARRPGLGAAFIREIEEGIRKILETPDQWRIIEQEVRCCRTHRFPYGILYTL
jgi:toxin ParE1/3/4